MSRPGVIARRILDAGMTLVLLFLMGYQFWEDAAHEWAGTGMFVLFLAHHALNAGWYRRLPRGTYTPLRAARLVLNGLLLLCMAGLMVSGVLLSRHVFAFLPLRGGLSFARLLHMFTSYWGFVLMSLHLGLHWGMVTGAIRTRVLRKPPSRAYKRLTLLAGAGIALYGWFAFVRRNLSAYLLLTTEFVFLDFGEPVARFYLDYLAMMGAGIFIAHGASKLLQKLSKQKRD